MATVALCIRIYTTSQLEAVDTSLKNMLKGLKVKTEIQGTFSNNWVSATISGEDEKTALLYIAEKIGLCPASSEHLQRFSSLKGYIKQVKRREISVDIGVTPPNSVDVAIPLRSLQAQIADGRKMPLSKIADLFGFVENLPLTVKIQHARREAGLVEAELAEKQLATFRSWAEFLLDRLIVLGATFSEVLQAAKQSRVTRDVADLESLGLFEQVIVCKLGTDAAGLIPKIGRRLRRVRFSVFSPRTIVESLGSYWIT